MPRSTPPILPRLARLLSDLGDNIRKARLRRSFSAETVAQRAGITRKTLHRVECGEPAVALGIYARVLQALRLEAGLAAIAADDVTPGAGSLALSVNTNGVAAVRAGSRLADSMALGGAFTISKDGNIPLYGSI